MSNVTDHVFVNSKRAEPTTLAEKLEHAIVMKRPAKDVVAAIIALIRDEVKAHADTNLNEIAKEWAEETARIDAKNRAAGLVQCLACDGTGVDNEGDFDCVECFGDGVVRA